MTPRELEVLEWLIPALETFSVLRLDPVAYTHRTPKGWSFIVTNEEACRYAAELLRGIQREEKK